MASIKLPARRRSYRAGGPDTVKGASEREAAFELAFHEHYTRVFGVLFRLVGDRAEAEELVQETFWRLWQTPPGQESNLAGWLYRVALRMGYNAMRGARRRAGYEIQAGRDALENNSPPDPAQAAELNQQRAQVRAALARMSPRAAQLLVLRHSGLGYQEIAAALDVAPSSVGTLLARAEAEFERIYDE